MKMFEIFFWPLLDHLSRFMSTFFLLKCDECMSLKKHKRSLADCKHSSDWLTAVCPLLFGSTCKVDFCVRNLCNYLVRWRKVVKFVVLGMFSIIYLAAAAMIQTGVQLVDSVSPVSSFTLNLWDNSADFIRLSFSLNWRVWSTFCKSCWRLLICRISFCHTEKICFFLVSLENRVQSCYQRITCTKAVLRENSSLRSSWSFIKSVTFCWVQFLMSLSSIFLSTSLSFSSLAFSVLVLMWRRKEHKRWLA